MDQTLAGMSEQQLLDELDRVERAIARSAAFIKQVTSSGRTEVRVSADLLALAARERAAVEELQRRRRSPSVTGAATARPSGGGGEPGGGGPL